MEEKIITASFKKTKFARTETQWQYNSGQKLRFEGVDLPPTYEVHFSNSVTGLAKVQIGDETGVHIPQEYFIPGSEIYAWIYLTEEDAGVTIRQVTIPISRKARVVDQDPDPDERSVIDQLVAQLNAAILSIPPQIEEALAEAKESGEFDGPAGSRIWWTVTVPTQSGQYAYLPVDALNGTVGAEPNAYDYIYAPAIGGSSVITEYYIISELDSTGAYLTHICRVKGDQGFSPTVRVREITDGHEVIITDESGPHTFSVMDGHLGNMREDIEMNGHKIVNLQDGEADSDAVNLGQVSRMISDGSGLFRGSYATKSSLISASWQHIDPAQPYYVDNNDYCVVLNDESKGHECWRYAYTLGSGWSAQYRINEAPLTTSQINALNSGVTSEMLVGLEQFRQNAQAKLSTIESGAEVNTIEGIWAWDEDDGYVALPVSLDKRVYLPQVLTEHLFYTTAVYEGVHWTISTPKDAYSNNLTMDTIWHYARNLCQPAIVLSRSDQPNGLPIKLQLISYSSINDGKAIWVGVRDNTIYQIDRYELNVLGTIRIIWALSMKTLEGGGSGNDGATFIPAVSPEGVISWTNDGDLPNPEPVNIKGADGDPGVYIGSTEPTDPDARVWIDPTGDPDGEIYSAAEKAKLAGIEVGAQKNPDLSGYATESWVQQQGYLTQHQDISGKLDTNQGASHAGEFVMVGSDGNITTVTMTAWQGGSY